MTKPSGLEHEATPAETDERYDWDLLSAYVRGDEQAFESLVKRYLRLVHAVALRRLWDSSLAEEAAQSVFIILAHKAKSLSSGILLRVWLLKTTRFVCNDLFKSHRRRNDHEQPLEYHFDELTESNADDGQVRELVEQALLSLPAVEQACVVARFYEGRSFKELGKIFGITEDGAQKKVSRSLEKLRLFLSRRGIKTSAAVLSGCLWSLRAPPVPTVIVHSSLRVILHGAPGKAGSGAAVALAGRCLRLLTRREWFLVAARVVPLLLLVGAGAWLVWFRSLSGGVGPNDAQMERLGKEWSIVVLRVAAAKQTYQPTPAPNTPQFQALMKEAQFAIDETARIQKEVDAALKPAQDRQQMALFLTVEMRETLKLSRTQQTKIFNYVSAKLSNGATLKQAMKMVGATTSTEAGEVKVFLSGKQRQVFDRVYGSDGMCLFQYCKVVPD
jgi:RNA polymerase sigma factor (sigma-70 family)